MQEHELKERSHHLVLEVKFKFYQRELVLLSIFLFLIEIRSLSK
jgi:hypothetical protein